MKNLPDDELFGKLKHRLENFEELPDDDIWDNIASSISTSEPKWIRMSERIGLSLMLLLAFGAWYASVSWSPDSSAQSENAERTDVPFADEGIAPDLRKALADATHESGSATHPGAQVYAEESTSDQREMTSSQTVAPLISVGDVNKSKQSITYNTHDKNAGESRHVRPDRITSANENLPKEVQPIAMHDKRDVVSNEDALFMARNIALPDSIKDDSHEPMLTDASTNNSKVVTSADSAFAPKGPAPFNPVKRHKDSWTLYALTTPSLVFQHVKPSSSDDVTFANLNSPGVLSKERFSFSFEAGMQVQLGKRLAAFGGLTYYHQRIDLSLMQTSNGLGSLAQNASLDYNFDPNLEATVISYDMRNVGATTGLSYILSVGKLVHRLGGSLQYELGLINTSSESGQDRRDHFVNYRIFYRAEYAINERMTLFVQPSFTRSLLYHEVMNGALDVKQSRAGVGIGLLYRF